MAITKVNKLVGRESPESEDGTREYIEKYIVLADSKNDVGATIRRASFGGVTIPAIDDQYPGDSGARVRHVKAREEASNGVNVWKWIVEVEYSTDAGDAEGGTGGSGGGGSPLDLRWKRSWDWREISRPVEKATWVFQGQEFEDQPIATSPLNEVFDPGIEEEEYVQVLTIIRNQATYSGLFMKQFVGRTSLNAFYGFPPGEALMLPPKAEEQFRESLRYWEVRYEIAFKDGGWYREILNQGYWYNDANGNAVKDDYNTLRNIDIQTGRILGPAEDPQYLVFIPKQKKPVDFGPLNLQ